MRLRRSGDVEQTRKAGRPQQYWSIVTRINYPQHSPRSRAKFVAFIKFMEKAGFSEALNKRTLKFIKANAKFENGEKLNISHVAQVHKFLMESQAHLLRLKPARQKWIDKKVSEADLENEAKYDYDDYAYWSLEMFTGEHEQKMLREIFNQLASVAI